MKIVANKAVRYIEVGGFLSHALLFRIANRHGANDLGSADSKVVFLIEEDRADAFIAELTAVKEVDDVET